MDSIGTACNKIYDFFHGNNACFGEITSNDNRFAAYYNSMYLLQDSTESLRVHRKRGFSGDPHLGYIEFWGVMQAVTIQQDAIREVHKAITGEYPDTKSLPKWNEVRDFRHILVGHPAKRDRGSPLSRTFMGRDFGNYDAINFEKYEQGVGTSNHEINLGDLLDEYDQEAGAKLLDVLQFMQGRWPS